MVNAESAEEAEDAEGCLARRDHHALGASKTLWELRSRQAVPTEFVVANSEERCATVERSASSASSATSALIRVDLAASTQPESAHQLLERLVPDAVRPPILVVEVPPLRVVHMEPLGLHRGAENFAEGSLA